MKTFIPSWLAVTMSLLCVANIDAQLQTNPSTRYVVTGQTVSTGRAPNPYLIRQMPARSTQDAAVQTPIVQSPLPAMPAPTVSPTMPSEIHQFSDDVASDSACGCETAGGGQCRRLGSRLGERGCNSCGTVPCPRCEGDVCRLELDHSPKKKTCFKTEQASICIPPVRFPWQRDCPPGVSKTKLVTRLKVHEFECPNCSYKWKLDTPEKSQATSMTPSLFGNQESPTPSVAPVQVPLTDQTEEQMDEGTVPKAPMIKGAFNRWGFGRKR